VRTNQNRLSLALISVGTMLIVAAVTLMALVLTGVINNDSGGNSDLKTVAGFGPRISSPTPGPTPTPSSLYPPGDNSPIERLVVTSQGINAPVVVKGVDAAGVMQSPDNAYDTVWYDFSARPGFDGNAVFAGHVDYIHVGKAVFWNLKDLNQGDVIEVHLKDGTVYRYAVTSKQQYDSATAPVDQIVGPTPGQTVTLITCGGTFDYGSHQYDKRLVVRAERIVDGGAPPAPAAQAPGA
jgi:LPXTG-site transpeptidase (sortase) family protein